MSISKHKNYHTLKLLIEAKQLTQFGQIFDHIPPTTIYKDLGINFNRFKKLRERVQGFKLEELYSISYLIGVDEKAIVELAHNEYMAKKKTIRKKQ
jgi:hypothetical protein